YFTLLVLQPKRIPVLPIPHITNPMISFTQAPGTHNLRTPVAGTQVPTSYRRTLYGCVTSELISHLESLQSSLPLEGRQPLILSDSSHDFGQRSYTQEFPTTYASASGSCLVPPVTTSGQEDIRTDIQQLYPSQLEKLEVTVHLLACTLVPSIGTISGQLAALFHTIQEVKSDVQTLNKQYKLKEQDLTKEEIVLLWEFVNIPGISVRLVSEKKSSFLTNMATILSEEKSKLKSKLQNSTIHNLPVKELAHSLFLDKTFKTATPIQQSKLKTSAAHWGLLEQDCIDFTAETDLEELDGNNLGPFASDNAIKILVRSAFPLEEGMYL
ncbi:hypothetical protein L873DRAFT_1819793, partial [Choiromyces venosus 120613-1]